MTTTHARILWMCRLLAPGPDGPYPMTPPPSPRATTAPSHTVGPTPPPNMPTPPSDMPTFVASPSGFPTLSSPFLYQAYDDPPATTTAPPPSPGHIVPPQSSTFVSSPTLSDLPTPYAPPGFEPVASPEGFEHTVPLNPDFTTPSESPGDELGCI
uniref:protein TRACHEARY ELEMENT DIFFERENTIATION-RELATED 7A-like n=1 Tax=Erigeron canadensis TaxID=72917 RepID=UPI001CB9B289|nr:protein TRACHEARY ELEMENT DIFFERENTIATION-RELATED 7A-like [Erigeron canadensis]